ncbi:hypothetical protein QQM39_00005 [Streptomyces sp. DT2A-34]|uniref:hypothetical protein n=1 Tax=Streptomyces sp. DT2A-34 TaxID=3051182 RepID=UPI00265B98B6|nr:hypothetical protein [Streptomyces sp. DT2A-34]MDO0909314.1 hypothetical protein [Streptomyces sp. DT2A-34]
MPTWHLTRKFAQTCGADPEVLRTVWESEKLSEKSRETAVKPGEPPSPLRNGFALPCAHCTCALEGPHQATSRSPAAGC